MSFPRWMNGTLLVLILAAASAQVRLFAQQPQPHAGTQNPPGVATKGLVTQTPYEPITGGQRLHWVVKSTIGPESLLAGALSAGINTARNDPVEYGPTWGGFGERFGMRLTGISAGNAMEASLGALWGEDPRYPRMAHAPFGARVRNVIQMTFTARYSDGHVGLAYARLMAISGNNALSNRWRAASENGAGDAAVRTVLGVLGRMGANAFAEFWPEVRRRIVGREDDKN